MEKNPLVTILVPTLNSGKRIRDCIFAIEAQTYLNVEVVVVDGGSSDDTLEILHGSKMQMNLVAQRSKGIWAAMNEGIAQARGEFIFHLNSDDIITRCALQSLVKLAQEKMLDVVWLPTYSAGGYINKVLPGRMWLGMHKLSPGHSASFMIRRSSCVQLGGYDTNIKYCSDHELFLRLFLLGARFRYDVVSDLECYGVFAVGGYSSRNDYLAKVLEEFLFRRKHIFHHFPSFLFCVVLFPCRLAWGSLKRLKKGLLR